MALLVALLGVAGSAGLVWNASTAAFTATTGSEANALGAGTVVLSDDDAGSALFAVDGLGPGSSTSQCTTVTYSGSLPATVRGYGTVGGSGVADHLEVVVTRGTSPSTAGGSCAGFVPDAADLLGEGPGVVHAGVLSSLPTAWAGGWLDRADAPAPVSELWTTGEQHSYRIAVSLPAGASRAAEGLTATASFAWEARDAGQYADVVLADAPVGYWRLDDPPGTTAADAAGSQDGYYRSLEPRSGSRGAVDGGGFLQLDEPVGGTTRPTLRLPRLVSADFSLELWFDATQGYSAGSGQWWFHASLLDGEVGGVTDDFGVTLSADGAVHAGTGNPDVSLSTPGGYADGQWHHVVLTRRQSTGVLALYVDGQPVASTVGAGTQLLTSPWELSAGEQLGGDRPYVGGLDEVAQYDYVLSPAQVQAHYDAR